MIVTLLYDGKMFYWGGQYKYSSIGVKIGDLLVVKLKEIRLGLAQIQYLIEISVDFCILLENVKIRFFAKLPKFNYHVFTFIFKLLIKKQKNPKNDAFGSSL